MEGENKDIIRLAKRALALISMNYLDEDLVFELRDAIRKAEGKMRGEENAPDEVR